MDHVTVPVTPDAGANETMHIFIRAARDWLKLRPTPVRETARGATPAVSTVPDTPHATCERTPRRDGHGHGT
jgi:hypothetical protein